MRQPDATCRSPADLFDHNHAPALMDRQGVRIPSLFSGSVDPRAFLVDDDGRLRARVRELLEYEGMTVVGEASSGPEALDLVPAAAAAEPLVILMDVRMPGRLNGIEATRLLVQSCGAMVRALVFTGFPGPGIEQAARTAGAVAVLVKGDPIGLLLAEIDGAWDGVRVAAR